MCFLTSPGGPEAEGSGSRLDLGLFGDSHSRVRTQGPPQWGQGRGAWLDPHRWRPPEQCLVLLLPDPQDIARCSGLRVCGQSGVLPSACPPRERARPGPTKKAQTGQVQGTTTDVGRARS